MAKAKKYWLLKTEPSDYSIEDLSQEPNRTTCWDGVRNYQARNMLRDEMKVGDEVLIYHSGANPPAIVGVAKIVREGYPDRSAQDKTDPHFDATSTAENPRWYSVDVKLSRIFQHPLSLPEMRHVEGLENMELLRKGSRLSVQSVSEQEFAKVTTVSSGRA